MTELTDLQIARQKEYILFDGDRVVKIVNLSLYCRDNNLDRSEMTKLINGKKHKYKSYRNPLTDDALCFKFCYEHEILVRKVVSVVDYKLVWNGEYYAKHPSNHGFGSVSKSPNKAVCLEYIELNKERQWMSS